MEITERLTNTTKNTTSPPLGFVNFDTTSTLTTAPPFPSVTALHYYDDKLAQIEQDQVGDRLGERESQLVRVASQLNAER